MGAFQSTRNMNPFLEGGLMTPGGSQANVYASTMRSGSGAKPLYSTKATHMSSSKHMLRDFEGEGGQTRGFNPK